MTDAAGTAGTPAGPDPDAGEILAVRLEGWAAKLKPSWKVAVGVLRWLAIIVVVATIVLVAAVVSIAGPLGLIAIVVGAALVWALWRVRVPLVALGGALDNVGAIGRAVPGRLTAVEAQLRQLTDKTERKKLVGPVAMVRFARESRGLWEQLSDVSEFDIDIDALKSAADPKTGLALSWIVAGIPLLVVAAGVAALVALVMAVL